MMEMDHTVCGSVKQHEVTVTKDGEAQEIQVALPFHRIPSNIRVAFSQQQRAALQSTAGQVLDDLAEGRPRRRPAKSRD